MKTIATLALIMALLGFPAVNASADTFTLWDNFPQVENGHDGFYAAGYDTSSNTLYPLTYTADYSFSGDGHGALPVVQRTGSQILLQSLQGDNNVYAVYYGVPPAAVTVQVTGQFALPDGTTAGWVQVNVGTTSLANPSGDYISLFSYDFSLGDPAQLFNITIPSIDSTQILAFFVTGDPGAQANLEGTITSNPVPLPGALLLFGSGLLGLAGWRRLRKS